MVRPKVLLIMATIILLVGSASRGDTVSFSDPFPPGTIVSQDTTSDTIRSSGYLFTYTRDKLFTGGLGGPPIGRPVRVPWPQGIEAQAVTAGPNPSKAKITLQRVDAGVFDFTAFSAKLLANTAGAGGTFEVVPFLHGEEQLPNPVTFNATGVAGNIFSYDRSPNLGGTTIALVGYDKYTIDLYVDFALVGLSLDGAPIPPAPGDYNEDGIVNAADYTVWRNHLGEPIALPNEGLFTTPGEVTPDDYSFWKAHYGQMAGGAAAAIPEPSNVALIVIGVMFMFRAIEWQGSLPEVVNENYLTVKNGSGLSSLLSARNCLLSAGREDGTTAHRSRALRICYTPPMPLAKQITGLLFFLVITFAAAAVGSAATSTSVGDWYQTIAKPAWTPPSWLFGPVWTLLFLLMAVAAWLVWRKTGTRDALRPLAIYVTQLALNTLWSVLFFGLRQPTWAAIEIVILWFAIAATLSALAQAANRRPDVTPYLAWVTFAAGLNFAIASLNA